MHSKSEMQVPPLHREYPDPGIAGQEIVGVRCGKHPFQEPGSNGAVLKDPGEEDNRRMPLAQPYAFDVERVSRALPNICQRAEHRRFQKLLSRIRAGEQRR